MLSDEETHRLCARAMFIREKIMKIFSLSLHDMRTDRSGNECWKFNCEKKKYEIVLDDREEIAYALCKEDQWQIVVMWSDMDLLIDAIERR